MKRKQTRAFIRLPTQYPQLYTIFFPRYIQIRLRTWAVFKGLSHLECYCWKNILSFSFHYPKSICCIKHQVLWEDRPPIFPDATPALTSVLWNSEHMFHLQEFQSYWIHFVCFGLLKCKRQLRARFVVCLGTKG